jgi:tetratricopeptide (TPR) repeat protein
MPLRSAILLLAVCLAAQAARAGNSDPFEFGVSCLGSGRIDSLEKLAIRYLYTNRDSAFFYNDMALKEAESADYVLGMAVGLAFKADLIRSYSGDFLEEERLARESLKWFERCTDKSCIRLAYNQLGFSLYAQSRFAESIRYLQKDYDDAIKAGVCKEAISALSLIGYAYREWGNYERSFDISLKCLQYAGEIKDSGLIRMEYFSLADLFMLINDYEASHKYFWLSVNRKKLITWEKLRYAELLMRQRKLDSAEFYLSLVDTLHTEEGVKMEEGLKKAYLLCKGEYFVSRGNYGEALPYFLRSLHYQRQLTDRNQLMRCLNGLSRTYRQLGQTAEAFRYAREELALAKQTDARLYIREGCLTLYTLFDKEGPTDSAYFYYRRYITLKDSLLNDQVKAKFASYGLEQQIKWLNQEKQLNAVCLREEMMVKNILIGAVVVLALFSFIYVWIIRLKKKNEAHRRQRAENELEIQRLEGERAKAALQQRAKELEIQALRSQMNPHFIFNCLNAINRFILSHETEAASDYLTKFSRLMRMIMNHSRHSLITLAEEVEILELYLGMEVLRFRNAFDYRISIEEGVDTDDVRIPPLLLQPFVENAIWHGLMHREERGLLYIGMRVEGDKLVCVIRDNGIGRQRATQLKSKSVEKHKSMGLQITAERMALLTGTGETGHFFRIEDLYDSRGNATGTEVILTIRINSTTGEPVGALG